MTSSQNEPLLSDKADEESGLSKQNTYALWRSDLWEVCQLSGPACLQLLFQYAVIVTNQSFAGHLGANELAAAAIAVTAFNFLWYFLLGLSSAQDTLGSQAYGANDRAGVISWSCTTALCMSVLAVPMAVVLYFGDALAKGIFQQPQEVADLVAIYCQGMIPGLLPLVWSIVIMKAMQAQNIMWGPTWMTVLMFFANLGLNVWLMRTNGFIGVAYAQSAGRIIQFLLLVLYVWLVDNECLQYNKPCWIAVAEGTVEATGEEAMLLSPQQQQISDENNVNGHHLPSPVKDPSPEEEKTMTTSKIIVHGFAWKRIGIFLKLGLPGGLMMAADASAFDITTAMAGFLGTVEVGAHTALLTLCVFVYMAVPFGIATAATIRVGNMLGAGNPSAAQRTAFLTVGLCLIYSSIVTILIAVFRKDVGYIFTNAPKVVALCSKISILAAVYQLPDAVYGVFSGVLRGMGRQAQLVLCNVLGFWIIGTLTGWSLAFPAHLGVSGLWIGIIAGVCSCAVITSTLLYLVNWEAESEKAKSLVMKADLAEALLAADLEQDGEDSFDPPQEQGSSSEPAERAGTAIPRRMRSHDRPPSSHTSRGSSPEGRPIMRRISSVGSHGHSYGALPVGSVSSTLTGSYIASLRTKDYASANFRRV